jgi:trans-AT polyketide synthase, acyltransferase and oxidoreductase domains
MPLSVVKMEESHQTSPNGPAFDPAGILAAASDIRSTLHVVARERDSVRGLWEQGDQNVDEHACKAASCRKIATLSPQYPEWLGDRAWGQVHHARFPYAVGEMARGLTSIEMVVAGVKAGFMAFFGAAGLSPQRIDEAVAKLSTTLGADNAWGSNLIHRPDDPAYEDAAVDVYLKRGVRRMSVSAFMSLTPAVVRYAASGLGRDAFGRVRRSNHVFAKVSRPEIARLFMAPPPGDMLASLVQAGRITADEAALAATLPIAQDLTVEGDSGGHTDNRPLQVIFPAIAAMRDAMSSSKGRRIRLGAAGGLGTPAAVASAFALGADFVMTGSVNQCSAESGLGAHGRQLLNQAGIADVMMAPSADMFELGARVQVLRRGTMFGVRAQRLYDLYCAHESIDALPASERKRLETEIFKKSLDEVLDETLSYWAARDPAEHERALRDPRHRMALCFRWYLGQASHWAIEDVSARQQDFQIWCGPAMGAFNDWVRGGYLDAPQERGVAQIGWNLLEGACAVTRANQIRSLGVNVPSTAFSFAPRPLEPAPTP